MEFSSFSMHMKKKWFDLNWSLIILFEKIKLSWIIRANNDINTKSYNLNWKPQLNFKHQFLIDTLDMILLKMNHNIYFHILKTT